MSRATERLCLRLAIGAGTLACLFIAVPLIAAQVRPDPETRINSSRIEDLRVTQAEQRAQIRSLETSIGQLAVINAIVAENRENYKNLESKFDRAQWALLLGLAGMVVNLVFTYRGYRK